MIGGINSRWIVAYELFVLFALWTPWCHALDESSVSSAAIPSDESSKLWQTLMAQGGALGLPTTFLNTIHPQFVTVEFDDLHAFAAEYHPYEHRMVLNRSLSFNEAGGALKSLASLAPRDLGTLYHELFHAYMDYASTTLTPDEKGSHAAQLLAFAKTRQECRYQHVMITPILQRKSHVEPRVLTDRESWEALNETWAVFVGWVVWTRLEGQRTGTHKGRKTSIAERERWLKRLKKADRDADLIGYYEPEEPSERMMARKRYLAPSYRISPQEVAVLLEHVFEHSPEEARRFAAVMEQSQPSPPDYPSCRD